MFSLILLAVGFYVVFSDMEKYFPYPEVVPIIKIGVVMFMFGFYIYMAFGRENKTTKDNTDSSEESSERTLDESKEDSEFIAGAAAGTVIGSQLTKNNDDSATEKVESSDE